MPVTAGWDEEVKSIYIVQCVAPWEWVEFANVIRESFEKLGKLDTPVDLMMAFDDNLPKGNAMQYLSIAGQQPPNFRHTVMVNRSGRFLEMIVKTADKARGWEGPAFVKTIDDGREYLLKQTGA